VQGAAEWPNATGDQCPEGWTLYQYLGPGFAGIGDNSAEASYYTWVDQHKTLGLRNDVPISTGNESDALLALVDGKWVVLRVPYPLSFYAKGMDGRIDDPNAGWKGHGVWQYDLLFLRHSRQIPVQTIDYVQPGAVLLALRIMCPNSPGAI
jgi:hypothetical protein